MEGVGVLSGVALECPDPAALAEFYRRLTGWKVDHEAPDWFSLGDGSGLHLSFQRAPGYRPPRWPDPRSSMQFHLHVRVTDLDAAESEVLALGATKCEHQPSPNDFRVFVDPVGHVFCLCPTRP